MPIFLLFIFWKTFRSFNLAISIKMKIECLLYYVFLGCTVYVKYIIFLFIAYTFI